MSVTIFKSELFQTPSHTFVCRYKFKYFTGRDTDNSAAAVAQAATQKYIYINVLSTDD